MAEPGNQQGIWNIQSLIGEPQPADSPPVLPVPESAFVPTPEPEHTAGPPAAGPVVPPAMAVPIPSPVSVRTPSSTSSSRLPIVIVAAATVLVLVVGTVVALQVFGSTPGSNAGTGPVSAPTDQPAYQPTEPPPVPTETSTPTAEPTTTNPEANALASLNQLRSGDLPSVPMNGQYVAQLASKVVGITDPMQTTAAGSHTFAAVDILAEHLALRNGDNRGARVVLLLSTDFGKRQLYQGRALWVTFALGDFGTADEVRTWCAGRFPTLSGNVLVNQCAPRRLLAS